MRSSGRSKLAAATVFAMIAAGIVGGMAWATSSSFALAKKTIQDERDWETGRAVWKMDSYINGILYRETARSYSEYRAMQYLPTAAVFSDDGIERSAYTVVVPSPLAAAPPAHDWIDLYFQVDQEGIASSPHVVDESNVWTPGQPCPCGDTRRCSKSTLEWFQSSLASFDLREHVSRAIRNYGLPDTSDKQPGESSSTAQKQWGNAALARHKAKDGHDLSQRRKSARETQAAYRPRPECVAADIAERNVSSFDNSRHYLEDQASPATNGGGVQIDAGVFTTFWFEPGPDGHRKLAFVRECAYDTTTFYQGFVGDWNLLEKDLLETLGDSLPGVRLEPVVAEPDSDRSTERNEMVNLPVRLVADDSGPTISAAAWQQVRSTVLAIWLAAGAVLGIAGFGLRSIVATSERRTQFAYAVTHELRTPLTTFRLYSDMLSAGLVPDDSKQEYLNTLNRESVRLSSLVEGVLEYSRLENQRVKLRLSNTDGPALLQTIGATLENRCREEGVEARTANDLTNGQQIRTDVDVVNRIAGVLVNNACRHARGQNGSAVLVRLCGDNGQLQLSVIDSGLGIDRRDSRTIFKPFTRGHRADETAQGGIGLGLALASNWAMLLGGRLELADRNDPTYGGAHFRLTIPARIDD